MKKNRKKLLGFVVIVMSLFMLIPGIKAAYDNYTVTLAVDNGTITSTSSLTVADGDSAVYTVVPDENYEFRPANSAELIICDLTTTNAEYNTDTNTLTISGITSDTQTVACNITFVECDPDVINEDETPVNPDTAASPVYMVAGLGVVGLMYGIYLSKKKFA